MKCREEDQQTVMSIFYEVDPSDVRKQTGDFGKTFDETCVGKTEEVKQTWKQALKDVAGIAGYHSSNCGNEADLINKVASDVTAVLGFTPSRDFDDFVGIGDRITEIKSKLILQSEQVKVIVLVGPAGIGKTTTARVLYNQLSGEFPFSTFVEDIRGSFEKPCGNDYQLKLRLHQNLLSQLLNQKDMVVGHLGVAPQMLSGKKVLVVLDEVDSWWQLESMANKPEWFSLGSTIIITTEDRRLFKQLRLGMDHVYEMKFPTSTESLQIFCQYAFGQNSPEEGFEMLAWEVTGLAGNLPLGLRVMGSYLRGMSREEWIDALPRLRSSLDREIDATLRFSFDGLTDKDKAIFLHIACFFVGVELFGIKVDSVKSILAKSGLDVDHGIQILADKSLISLDYGMVYMHPLLEKMGREIVMKQSLEEPGKRQFLWDTTEITEVLEESTGTGTVLSILLYTSMEPKIQISKSAFQRMNNLQFLKVDSMDICIPDGLNCLPDKLRFLHWKFCPLRFWSSEFSVKFLVELVMQHSKFEKLWEGIKPLHCLKLMDLSYSQYLKEIPDLSKATSLEKLVLDKCDSLLELTSSIGKATKLRVCKLEGCYLKELPSCIGSLINLEKLDLHSCRELNNVSGCSSLEKLSGCSSLQKLNLSDIGIKKVPSSVSTFSRLYKLDVSYCRNLKEFPNVQDSIVELVLSGTMIKAIPPRIENLFRLRKLIMFGCKKLKKISPNISKLENLEYLFLGNDTKSEHNFKAIIEWGPDFKRSWKLRTDFKVDYIFHICLPEKALTSPVSLRLRGDLLETVPDCIGRLSGLCKLIVTGCINLVALPQLPGSLLSIDAQDCVSLKRIDSSSFQNPNICLNFAKCYDLKLKARNLILTSACKYAFLPVKKVPAHFTYQSTSGSLTINLTPKPLPSSFRFKACILLSEGNNNLEDHNDGWEEEDEKSFMDFSCRVEGRQNGHTVHYVSHQLHMPNLPLYRKHLYIFEDSFSLNQDCLEAGETTFSELSFVFVVHNEAWKVRGCGARLCSIDGKETEDEESIGIMKMKETEDQET